MKKLIIALLSAAFAVGAFSQTLLIESEDFQFPCDWSTTVQSKMKVLSSGTSKSSPKAVFAVKKAGSYNVWASVMDFPKDRPGTRICKIAVDGKTLPIPAGKHGQDGFKWENVGKVDLEVGEHLLTIVKMADYCRNDAVLLTMDDKFDPNAGEFPRNKFKQKLRAVECTYKDEFPRQKPLTEISSPKKFSVQNADIKITFTEKRDENGDTAYERSAEVLGKDGKWVDLPPFSDECYFMLYANKIKLSDSTYFPSWRGGQLAKAKIQINGKDVDIDLSPTNPYTIAEGELLRITSVKQKGTRALELKFSNGAKGILELPKNGQYARMDISYDAEDEGYYSFGILANNRVSDKDVKSSFLPTIYQNKRLMREPKMVTTVIVSQPLSILGSMQNGMEITSGVAANPNLLPFEWSRHGASRYGFSLANPDAIPQTALFQPILGGVDSYKKADETLVASFYLLNVAGDWRDAFELANERIFAGSAMREPYDTSFSDAVNNIALYLKDGVHSGWSAMHKARWNIEGYDLATTASPMAEIEAALLMDDEEYYKNYALPTIEYTLSRKSSHFAIAPETNEGYGKKLYELSVPSKMWTCDYYAGLNALTGSKNPWLVKDFVKNPDGTFRFSNKISYGRIPKWSYLLGCYLASPTPELLEEIKKEADIWLENFFNASSKYEPNLVSFINSGLYPYWWYLPDLYELTGDKKYLDYADKGAFYSLSSLWNWPTPPEGDVVINKGGMARGVSTMWWKGRERHRVGYENQASARKLLSEAGVKKIEPFLLPEKTVPAMKVSRIGIGIEQHSTYIGSCSNILMPGWAAEMLRVYKHNDRDILMKFSRHTIIGRYANFLGYYIQDFTDVQHDPDYPVVGPDSTSFYYHHAPCHFAQSVDYLVSQLEVATKDKIKFPYMRQQGYVWFTDRIFGLPGEVFGEKGCRPLISKTAVRPDTPKVSTFFARGKNSVWVILLNDSASPLETSLVFDQSDKMFCGVADNADIEVFDSDGNKLAQTLKFFGDKKVKIPAQKVLALRIPAAEKDVFPQAAPLSDGGHVKIENFADGWGDLHAFRIRSPFGKDSLFVILTGAYGKENAKIKLSFGGTRAGTEITRAEYPFEISVYPVSMDEDLTFSVSVYEGNKLVKKSEEIVIKK